MFVNKGLTPKQLAIFERAKKNKEIVSAHRDKSGFLVIQFKDGGYLLFNENGTRITGF